MTCEQLSGFSGLSVVELSELVGYSALVPEPSTHMHLDCKCNHEWTFSAQWLKPLRAVFKLRNDFDLDLFTVAIVLGKLQRIEELERGMEYMQWQISRMTHSGKNTAFD